MAASTGFQSQVTTVPAPGVEGDFDTLNPVYNYPAGPGGLVAGTSMLTGGVDGVLVGRWLWTQSTYLDPDNAPTVVNNWGTGLPIGLLGRRQQGLITVFLAEASLKVPTGLPVSAISAADVWVVNRGATQALIGQKAYANFLDGSTNFAVTGAPLTGAASSSTGSIAAATFSTTGSIAGNVLTVTVLGSGNVYRGATITVGAATGTTIVAQLSGTPNGVGTYALSIGEQTVASTTISGTYGLLTLGTVTGGTFAINDTISGTGVTAGTTITDSITGSGGTGGTMVVSVSQTVSGQVITVASTNIETGFYAQSSGLAGELVKISRLP
jgi:hypothetical protein